MKIQTLLVPTDFSDGSRHALKVSEELGRALDAGVRLLHVVEKLPFYPFAYVGEVSPDEDHYTEKSLVHAKEELAERTQILLDAGVPCDPVVSTGYPAEEIAECSKEGVDLIVMATHGRSGFAHAMLGSITERVIRQAAVPVLSVKAPAEGATATPRFSKILYASDLSENSMAAWPITLELARTYGGKVDLISVMDDPGLHPLVNWELTSAENYAVLAETKTVETLRGQVRQQETETKVEVDVLTRQGVPYREIVAQADEGDYDLLVLTSHGRTGFRQALLGSVAEKLIRMVTCPVLTVPVRD